MRRRRRAEEPIREPIGTHHSGRGMVLLVDLVCEAGGRRASSERLEQPRPRVVRERIAAQRGWLIVLPILLGSMFMLLALVELADNLDPALDGRHRGVGLGRAVFLRLLLRVVPVRVARFQLLQPEVALQPLDQLGRQAQVAGLCGVR